MKPDAEGEERMMQQYGEELLEEMNELSVFHDAVTVALGDVVNEQPHLDTVCGCVEAGAIARLVKERDELRARLGRYVSRNTSLIDDREKVIDARTKELSEALETARRIAGFEQREAQRRWARIIDLVGSILGAHPSLDDDAKS